MPARVFFYLRSPHAVNTQSQTDRRLSHLSDRQLPFFVHEEVDNDSQQL